MANQNEEYMPVSVERRDELLNKIIDIIARYELFTPAAFFFSISKPLTFLGSQLMFFFAPIAGTFVDEDVIEEYAHLLSDRSNVERILDMMEEREQELSKQKKTKQGKKK